MASSTSTHSHDRKWWKEAVIYQIYPSSFYDSNGDGVGDIPGIVEKLPYLVSLGVDCIWLSPHYASPQIDMGYDISNYQDIYPPYGTLEQTQELIDACHAHNLKIIFDLVINHTSSEHTWFKESRSSKTNPKRDWYFWKSPRGWKDGKPLAPNNWGSIFSGPAWEFDEATQQFYLHLFATEMPDLNWENAETRKAIYETSMHFWLKRGIDGFRVDVANKYSKNIAFPDAEIINPNVYEQPNSKLHYNGPRMHEYLSEMYEVLSQYRAFDGGEIMTVGELPNTPLESDVRAYVSAAKKQLGMVFHFDTVSLGLGKTPGNRTLLQPYTAKDVKRTLAKWQSFVNGSDSWTTVFLENHDEGRSISRFGNDKTEELRTRSGKLLAMVLATMTGTLFLYQGQEIGMINMPVSWNLSEYKDVWVVNILKQLVKNGANKERMDQVLNALQMVARDHARTPMQWDESPHAGFCGEKATPWMRVNDNYPKINVTNESAKSDSLLNFWKRMIGLRKEYKDIFVYGTFTLVDTDDDIFAFIKEGEDGKRATTVANMSSKAVPWKPSSRLLLSNVPAGNDTDTLQSWEARIYFD